LLSASRQVEAEILTHVSSRSGLCLALLERSALDHEAGVSVNTSLDRWRELLSWFRTDYPYQRGVCRSCEARRAADPPSVEFLGNVAATQTERSLEATRAELQLCHTCGEVSRFPRYNDVRKILQQHEGRCGEYSAVVFQLARALGWRTRLVVDWTDHMWVEIAVPGAERQETAVSTHGHRGKCAGRRQQRAGVVGDRWVALDPCEAAVDMPHLYGDWGKTHTYVVAIGDGHIEDVTSTYARDWDATLAARSLSPDQLARVLVWVGRTHAPR